MLLCAMCARVWCRPVTNRSARILRSATLFPYINKSGKECSGSFHRPFILYFVLRFHSKVALAMLRHCSRMRLDWVAAHRALHRGAHVQTPRVRETCAPLRRVSIVSFQQESAEVPTCSGVKAVWCRPVITDHCCILHSLFFQLPATLPDFSTMRQTPGIALQCFSLEIRAQTPPCHPPYSVRHRLVVKAFLLPGPASAMVVSGLF